MKKRIDWFKETHKFYRIAGREKKPYSVKVLGKSFIVLPNVFSPKYFNDTSYFAGELPKIVKNKKLLEIGAATGIISIFCAFKKAKIIATDISSAAIKNCKLNCKKHGVKIDIRRGDMFKPIKKNEKFDFIFWNHPWNYSSTKPKNIFLRAGFDYKYNSLSKYIKEGKSFLNPGGKLLLGTGGFAKLSMIKNLAKKYGYEIKSIRKKKFQLDKVEKEEVYFIIYELKPKK